MGLQPLKNKNLVYLGRKFHKALRNLEKLAYGFTSLFSGLFYIWQCHPEEPGKHLSSTESSADCRRASSSGHSSQGVPGPLLLFWTISIRQLYPGEPGRLLPTNPAPQLHSVDLSKQLNYIFYFQPGTFIWVIRVNRVNFTSTTSHQIPSSGSSGQTGLTIWPSQLTGQISS